MTRTVTFYAVRERDVSRLRTANQRRLREVSGEPLGEFRDAGLHLGTVLGYLIEHEGLQLEPPRHANTLMDLVGFRGGGWSLLERASLAMRDPDRVSASRLGAYYVDTVREGAMPLSQAERSAAGDEMLRAVAALRNALSSVQNGHLLLIHD